MFCANCGNQLVAGAMFCGKCGTPAPNGGAAAAQAAAPAPTAAPYTQPTYGQPAYGMANPPKSFMTTWLFSFFLGGFGVDRFYVGNVGLGIGKLLTSIFGSFVFLGWIWPLIDLILVLQNKFKDAQGRPLEGYEQNKKTAIWVTVGVYGGILVLGLIAIIIIAIAAAAASTSYYY